MVLINNDSHEEEQKRQQCETSKCFASCAFDDLNIKFKRPKVYAIRNFPEGFEQLGAQTISLIHSKPLCSARNSGNLLGKKDSMDDAEDYSFEPFEIDVVCQQMSAHSEMDRNLEPMVENIVASDSAEVVELDDPKFNDPLRILGQEYWPY
ncbi:hypothetical protein CsSME_00044768 [Camellia sinensis var. sinensis]|uniref:Uncharacterized protein n=1 Tax=Camellia sinensis var. sinensis TaxID=542762 RepID=A0A4S4F1K5_CAMSN|nr:hypothetical protein TEA_026961 [Camellia sinensis var. sinensis]